MSGSRTEKAIIQYYAELCGKYVVYPEKVSKDDLYIAVCHLANIVCNYHIREAEKQKEE